MRILHPGMPVAEVAALGGRKAAGLRDLRELGLAVPEWRALPADAFTEHLRRCQPARGEGEPSPPGDPEEARRLREAILTHAPAPQVRAAIRRIEDELGDGPLAVRSSGLEEDGDVTSFAGQHESFLNVRGTDALLDAVLGCWASAFSDRSVSYRAQHGIPASPRGLAVVLQRLVPAEVSGVLFTANPLTGSRTERVVSGTWGLGEGLVSGAVDADTVVLDRAGSVRSVVLGDKSERYVPAAGGGVSPHPVAPADAAQACVDEDLLSRLGAVADVIDERLDTPQDIEWAVADGQLWALQCRPITSALDAPPGQIRTWDNSNIIESFRGVTSPLTYSFARRVYGEVYRHYAASLGLDRTALDQVEQWTPYLLGYFDGHVYYNLHNWYRLVGLAPFYDNGRRNLELTLGVREALPREVAESLVPYEPGAGPARLLRMARTRTVFAWRLLRRDRIVARFLTGFDAAFAAYDAVDYGRLPGDEVLRRYLALERDFVTRWGPVSITDQAIGVFFGLLAHLTRRWLPDAPPWLAWAAAGPGKVVSVEPAERLAELAEQVRADPALEALVRDTEGTATRQALADAGHHAFLARIDAYIDRFGYRSVDELKLEVPELSHDPASFFALLTTALGGGEKRTAADIAPHLRGLGPLRRLAYHWARTRAQRAFAAREKTRFSRTMAFGVVKRMFRALGADLARSGRLAAPADVYLLTLDEVIGAYEGTLVEPDLAGIVTRRSADHARGATAPERFTTTGAVYPSSGGQQWPEDVDDAPAMGPRDEMVGVAAGPGTATGPAIVVDTPHGVDGHVVVTYRTDPGWVAVLPSAVALLIERGSPLTHVAIVARELGVPTVVQIRDLTRRVADGTLLEVNGSTGRVRVVEPANHG